MKDRGRRLQHRSSYPYKKYTLTCILFLTGCGWHPLYQKDQVARDMGRIQVAYIPGRDGQILRSALVEGLHPFESNSSPRYKLSVTFSTTSQAIGYNVQGSTVRTEEQGSAIVALQDRVTNKNLLQETLTGSYSYPVMAHNPHTSSLSQERRYLLEYLAQRILRRVAEALEKVS